MTSRPKLSNKDRLDAFLSKKNLQMPADDGKEFNNSLERSYVIVRNIPKDLHSKDLRSFFSGYIEEEKFACFHYRHRPELQANSKESEASDKITTCCIVSFYSSEDREEFYREFHGRRWINQQGQEVMRRCFVDLVKVKKEGEPGSSSAITEADLREMIELKPPSLMPKGNVGTPSSYFLEQIRLCNLPSSIIPKLGITSKRTKRQYESVKLTYDTQKGFNNMDIGQDKKETDYDKWKNQEDNSNNRQNDEEQFDRDDDVECEEWERHEALHDDVTEQDRTKPKKYEEEMEIVWEKGGPGLVWYTDKNYWDEREKGTDCDWAWADDWDVDYSVYYEGKSSGDIDSRQAVEIREDEQLRTGKMEKSVFTRRLSCSEKLNRKRRHSGSDVFNVSKAFDGVGGKLMARMGWKIGTGLGKTEQGRVVPVAIDVEEEGQAGKERKGLGYRGEKMQRTGFTKVAQRRPIASVFDETTDKGTREDKVMDSFASNGELLFRRPELTKMKYR